LKPCKRQTAPAARHGWQPFTGGEHWRDKG